MPLHTEQPSLRFGCPACGIRLVVDHSLAGVEGPCPSCSAIIIAPPLGVSTELEEKKATPLAPRPRSPKPRNTDEDIQKPIPQPRHIEPNPKPVKAKRAVRSVSPTTSVSITHEEKKNTAIFLKILCALIIVGLICYGVFFVLKNR